MSDRLHIVGTNERFFADWIKRGSHAKNLQGILERDKGKEIENEAWPQWLICDNL